MRPSQEAPPHHTLTPIYDALYSEYRRSFRALPGDRSGEEDLGFTAFGRSPVYGGGLGGHQGHPPHTPQHAAHPQHLSTWQNLHTQHNQGRQHTGNLPAALPPGPRRGY